MTRRFLNLLAVCSLVLLVAALVAWRQSRRWYGCAEVHVAGRAYGVGWPADRIVLLSYPSPDPPPGGYQLIQHPPLDLEQTYASPQLARLPGMEFRALLGFGWVRHPAPGPLVGLFAPAWAVALAAAAFPAWWLPRERRRRRAESWRRRGRCGGCGYDLRATPGTCPECGAAADPAPRADAID